MDCFSSYNYGVSLSGDSALVGASGHGALGSSSGAAYYFKGLSSKSGIVNQDVKLLASDGAVGRNFGEAVSLVNDSALVSSTYSEIPTCGKIYYFRGLNSKSGTVNQDAILISSDVQMGDWFGFSNSLSGDSALVGSPSDDAKGTAAGSAYYFKGLSSKSGTVTQDVKLLASDGAEFDWFGWAVSLSGDSALVGTSKEAEHSSTLGSAYYYKGLNSKSGVVTQDVKLIASDSKDDDYFGWTVSLSGDSALVGAQQDDDKDWRSGSVYYFKGLSSKSGTVAQNVKFVASDGLIFRHFGNAVSLDGNRFVIGTEMAEKAYAGDIRAFTTLDAGNTSVKTDSLTATLYGDDLIVGDTTSNNTNTITIGDTMMVTAPGSVIIGNQAGANNNTLVVAGSLIAPTVIVGGADNSGNALDLRGTVTITYLHVYSGNKVYMPAGSTIDNLLSKATNIYAMGLSGNWVKVTPAFGYDPITGIISLPPITVPATIDNDLTTVVPTTGVPGGITVAGGIDADPEDAELSQVFEVSKMTVYTTTDILGTWSLAPRTGYAIALSADKTAFSLAVNPTADAARFYRIATTLQNVDANGAPVADDTVI